MKRRGLFFAGENGFTLVELLIVVAIIAIIAAIALPLATRYRYHGQIAAVHGECRHLYSEFEAYFQENQVYPESITLTDFSPLHLSQNMTQYLLNGQADAYQSPDDLGNNQEFWLQLSMAFNPSVQFVIANSDNALLAPGKMIHGIVKFKDGAIQE